MAQFYPVPSLKHLALIKITSTLWHLNDVADIEPCLYWPRSLRAKEKNWKIWLKTENKVLDKVSALPLPEQLKKGLSCFVRPFGCEIGTYLTFCKREHCYIPKISNDICLTPRGTIDKKKMAELLVQDESLDVAERFKIACVFCLEDHVLSLWSLLPEHPYKHPDFLRDNCRHIPFQLSYWLHILNGYTGQHFNLAASFIPLMVPRHLTFNELAFWLAADRGNEVATRYFYRKLIPAEKEKMLVKTAKNVSCVRHITLMCTISPDESGTDILCFLLSVMNEEQKKKLFREVPYGVLASFFDWPWQCFFSDMLQYVSIPIFPRYSHHILMKIEEKITLDFKDYNYREFFRVFWPCIPIPEKNGIIELFIKGSSLHELVKTRDQENIMLFLNDAATIIDEKNIFRGRGRKVCESLMCFERWHLLKVFIRNYALSKSMLIKLKTQIEDCKICTRGRKKHNYKLDKFLKIIDELIQECDKRTSEEVDHPAKKFCRDTNAQV